LHIGYFIVLLVLPLLGGYSVYHSLIGAGFVPLYFIGVSALFLRRWKMVATTLTASPGNGISPIFVSGGVAGATITLFGLISFAIGFGLRN
jgi:hypothetical protein